MGILQIKDKALLTVGTSPVRLIVENAIVALAYFGYTVTLATNSKKAFEIFTQDPNVFDLVITDQTMPEVTGDRLALSILSVRPSWPVIICTGYSHSLSREKAEEMGSPIF